MLAGLFVDSLSMYFCCCFITKRYFAICYFSLSLSPANDFSLILFSLSLFLNVQLPVSTQTNIYNRYSEQVIKFTSIELFSLTLFLTVFYYLHATNHDRKYKCRPNTELDQLAFFLLSCFTIKHVQHHNIQSLTVSGVLTEKQHDEKMLYQKCFICFACFFRSFEFCFYLNFVTFAFLLFLSNYFPLRFVLLHFKIFFC